MRKTSLAVTALLAAAAIAWAGGDPGKPNPCDQWTDKDIIEILTDVTLGQGRRPATRRGDAARWDDAVHRQYGHRGEQIRHSHTSPQGLPQAEWSHRKKRIRQRRMMLRYSIFWWSSRTIRAASMRKAVLKGTMTQADADKTLSNVPDDYMILVQGTNMQIFQHRGEEAFEKAAYLQLKKTKQKVYPTKVAFLKSADGNVNGAVFYFSKKGAGGEPTIAPDEKEIDFYLQMGGAKLLPTSTPGKWWIARARTSRRDLRQFLIQSLWLGTSCSRSRHRTLLQPGAGLRPAPSGFPCTAFQEYDWSVPCPRVARIGLAPEALGSLPVHRCSAALRAPLLTFGSPADCRRDLQIERAMQSQPDFRLSRVQLACRASVAPGPTQHRKTASREAAHFDRGAVVVVRSTPRLSYTDQSAAHVSACRPKTKRASRTSGRPSNCVRSPGRTGRPKLEGQLRLHLNQPRRSISTEERAQNAGGRVHSGTEPCRRTDSPMSFAGRLKFGWLNKLKNCRPRAKFAPSHFGIFVFFMKLKSVSQYEGPRNLLRSPSAEIRPPSSSSRWLYRRTNPAANAHGVNA